MTEFYRFRTSEKLLEAPFHELEQQTIFFAGVDELNDPTEDFRDIVWDGDCIVWSNLFKHYVHCLYWTFLVAALFGDEDTLKASDVAVEQTWDSLPTPEAAELFNEIWQRVRDVCEVDALAKSIVDLRYAGTRHKVRSDELRFYFQSVHLCAFKTIQDVFVDHNLREEHQRIILNSSQETLLTRNGFLDLITQIPEIDSSSSGRLFSGIEHLIRNVPLKHRFIPQEVGKKNTKLLVADFPRIYVDQLSRLLWPEWYNCLLRQRASQFVDVGQLRGCPQRSLSDFRINRQ